MGGDHSTKRLALRLRRQNRNGGGGGECSVPGNSPCCEDHEHQHAGESAADKLAQQLKEQLLRTQAEFDNFRKRSRRDQQQQIEQANKNLIEGLLPVLDNFQRAMDAPGDSVAALLSGIEMVRKQLTENLRQAGLETVDAKGQPFDPHVHEAVATGEAGEVPDNHVMDVLQPGYQLNGKLLRPAMVRVARA